MKTFFTKTLIAGSLFLWLAGSDVFAQNYPIGELVEGTMRQGVPAHYFPMKNWNDEGVPKEYNNKGEPINNIPQHYRNQGQWDTSPYLQYFYASSANSYMNLRLLPPKNYDPNNNDRYPLIIVLHGVGEAGVNRSQYGGQYAANDPRMENNDHHLVFGAREHLAARNRAETDSKHFPGYVMFPQARDGDWTGQSSDKVIEIVEHLIDEHNVDPLRIYVWGLSNGAVGTWAMINKRPDLFAAAMPMSGVTDVDWLHLAHMPIWLFQGSTDKNPSPGYAKGQLDKLRVVGGTPRYTEYEGKGHGIWYDAYTEPDFFSWMLQYSELSIHAFFDKTEICAGQELDIKLGISPGHAEYQWSLNGIQQENIIEGSNHYNFEPSELGKYRVRIRRQGEMEWTQWSDPVDVKISDLYVPQLVVSHSTMKQSLDKVNTVTLSYPGEYEKIEWYYNFNKDNSTDGTNNDSVRLIENVRTSGMYWQARIQFANGCWSEFSDTIYMETGAPSDVILPPSSLSIVPVSEDRVNLLWEDNSNDERGFEIYRTKDDNPYANTAIYTFVALTEANDEFYVDKNLEPNTTYYYRMRAINWNGTSPYTEAISGTTLTDIEAPSRPGNLTAYGNFDSESISLHWNASTDNEGVTGYNIYEVVGGIINSTPVGNTTSETTYIVTGLEENSQHTYVVKAIDAAGNESEQSNQATANSLPCGLAYKLYETTSSNDWSSIADLQESQIIATGRAYNFDINIRTEQDQFGGGDGDDHFGFEFEGFIYIEEAGDYTFQLNSDDGSILWINGAEVVNFDGLHGIEKTEHNIPTGTYEDLSIGKHHIRVKYFENGGGQVLTLKYRNDDSGTAYSLIPDEALCGDNVTSLSAPFNLTAETQSERSIELIWNDENTNVTGFEVFRSESEDGVFELVHVTNGSSDLSYTDTGLDASTYYYYKLKAIGVTGESQYSNIASAITGDDTTPPSPVLNLTVVNNSDHNARLSWTESTDNVGVVGYNIYRHFEGEEVLLAKADAEGDAIAYVPQAEGEMALLNEAESNPTMYFLLRGLSSGTNYTLEVKAVDAAGNESVGNSTDNFNTGGPTPQPIELKSFSAKVENKTVKLTWKTASETDNNFFTLERADNSKDFYEIGTVDGAGTSIEELAYSFTDYNPVNGKMYYRLKQTDFNGDFKYFDIISVQYAFAGNLILYPNPTSSDNINLRLEGNSNFEPGLIKILDVVGNSYLESSFETDDLATGVKVGVKNALTPGLYFVIIEQGDTVSKMKLIIK